MLKRGFQFAPGYRLQEFLGRGQFGQVWRATAPGGAGMAAKFIDLSDGQGQKEYEGVRRVKQIRHANLMPITAIWLLDAMGQVIEEAPDEAIETIDLSVVEPKGQSAMFQSPAVEPSWLVVAMLLGGKSLQQRLRECIGDGLSGIPPKELISYMDESAKGIDFLNSPQHDLGEGPIAIQHSDIKPANIVLIGSSAVVCDFGLARILTRNQVTATSAAGTPAYMAPEAISGKPARTSDQYSLAVTYYHLRTGQLPVSDGSLWEVLDAHRLGKLRLGLVSEAEQEVLRKATSLKWENRFESNVEFVEALREALRSEGHTKPAFVSKLASASAASNPDAKTSEPESIEPVSIEGVSIEGVSIEGEPHAEKDDPTATLDFSHGAPSEASSNQSLLETSDAIAGEKSTHKEGFIDESLAELSETPLRAKGDAAASLLESLSKTVRQNPRLSGGIAVGAIVLLMSGLMMRGDSNPVSVPGDSDHPSTHAGESRSQEDALEKGTERNEAPDPIELIQQATTQFASDERGAVSTFQQALSLGAAPSLEPQRLLGLQGPVMKMAITSQVSRTQRTKLVAMADGPTPLLWDLTKLDSDPVRLQGHDRLLHTFAISPDGGRLLTGGADYNARVWNLRSREVPSSMIELQGHQQGIEAVAWHPTQDTAVTASADLNLRVWNIGRADDTHPNGTVAGPPAIPIQETLTALTSDPTGQWLAAKTEGMDAVDPQYDVLVFPWQELLEVEGSPKPIRLGAPNAKFIAFLTHSQEPVLICGDRGGSITLYSIPGGEMLTRFSDAHASDIESMRVVPVDDGDVIVTGASDGSVQWRHYGKTAASSVRHFSPEYGISSVDVTEDGRWIAAGTNDGSVWVWDTQQPKDSGAYQILTDSNSIESVVIDTVNNQLIAGGDDGVLLVWNWTITQLMALAEPTPTGGVERTLSVELPKFSMR